MRAVALLLPPAMLQPQLSVVAAASALQMLAVASPQAPPYTPPYPTHTSSTQQLDKM